jgi:protein-S-isoprenylcysteine O-methyltransferase Ste14
MTAQLATSDLRKDAMSPTKGLQRVSLFILFLLCEAAIFLFGSHYFDVFPTNKNLTYNLIVCAVFLIASRWLKSDPRGNRFWQIAFAFFIASIAYPFTAIFDPWIRAVLRWFAVTTDTSQGLAIEKICEMLLKTVPILVLVKLSGADFGSVYVKRGNLKLGIGVGLLVFFFLAPATFMFAAGRFTSVDTLVAAVVWGLVFSFANGFMEELWLRGIFLKRFEPMHGRYCEESNPSNRRSEQSQDPERSPMNAVNKFPNLGRTVFLRAALGLPIMALIIILPAGRWNYWQGWMYFLTMIIPMFFMFAYLLQNDPALLERRMRMREKEAVQRKIIFLSFLYFLVAFILPGLDVRFGWSKVPPFVSIIANTFFFAGYMVFCWVLLTNSFVSRVVEVESDQKVISTGPYALVRHPMYAGVIIMYLASPVALGSYWALLPAVLIVPLLIARIYNEEQVLRNELPGYVEYLQKVKYRLLPGVW